MVLPDLKTRLELIRERIDRSARGVGRDPKTITLLAVTKTFPVETILGAYGLGLRTFGENRVQEALGKIPLLPSDCHWHLIGPLQTNKINKVVGKFDLLQAVDSFKIAESLSTRLEGRIQDVLLEVNTSNEASKGGVSPEVAHEVSRRIAELPGLRLRGLMTVGPLTEDADRQRKGFRELKVLFDSIRGKTGEGFDVLSMGMSLDFEIAIEEGSTLLRIGSALFGERV